MELELTRSSYSLETFNRIKERKPIGDDTAKYVNNM